jgi:4-carboxymuconolactone decarboxylase
MMKPLFDGPDRLPPLTPAEMSAAQAEAAAELAAGPRGGVIGPFVPLLRSPELMRRVQRTGEYLRYHSVLPKHLSEFVILLVAKHWQQPVEWTIHHPIALAAGVSAAAAEAILTGVRPSGMSDEEAAIYDFCMELFDQKSVSDERYAKVLALFGEPGVIDLTGICGYYSLLAMVMNVARTPA